MNTPLSGTQTGYYNFVDKYLTQYEAFFSLDKAIIQAVIDEVNKSGTSFSYWRMKALTKAGPRDATQYRDVLGEAAHAYLRHREDYEDDLTKSKAPSIIKDAIRHFIEKLDEKGLNGLDILHTAVRTVDQRPRLIGISQVSSFISDIRDHDGKIIGYLPLVKYTLVVENEDRKRSFQTSTTALDDFGAITHSFNAVYNLAKGQAKEYRNKLGDLVMIPEDDGL